MKKEEAKEIIRLKRMLKKLNEWRHSDEVESTFTLVAIHSYAPIISEEFKKKYWPLLAKLDKEFPVKKVGP